MEKANFEADEMRTVLLFKHFSSFNKQLSSAVQNVQGAQQQQKPNQNKQPVEEKKVEEKPFTYDFKKEIQELDRSIEKLRLNQVKRSYEIPPAFLKHTQPEFLIGSILRIYNVVNYHEQYLNKLVTISGWIKTCRDGDAKKLLFIEVNDGSSIKNLQVVVHNTIEQFQEIYKLANTGASVKAQGLLVKSEGKGQVVDLLIKNSADQHYFQIIGNVENPKNYPMAKVGQSYETLREKAHLRPRSNAFGCVTRIRNSLAYATHQFFQQNGFLYIHTPLITASDCEGAGEMFQVTTLLPEKDKSLKNIPVQKKNKELIDYSKDFFKKPAFLTVSGQLNVENFCCSLSNVYTFGPTFRAEVSHTTRHLAEFWMIEPELAFADIHDDMDCAEAYFKFCLQYVLNNNQDDLIFLGEKAVKRNLVEYLQKLIKEPFERLTYTDAVKLLIKAVEEGKVFEHEPVWGEELYTEHEKFLAEFVFKKPICVYNYPADKKAFYMRLNDDQKTVAAFDLLAPQVGEVIGGSQREERLDVLTQRIKAKGLIPDNYWWYTDLRKYGTVPHAGFGLGFERLVMIASGMENIRDVIPFPRVVGNAEF